MKFNPWNGGRADRLPGSEAIVSARILIIISLCAFQYWLLTATMEAYQAGHSKILAMSFGASLLCFILAAGLLITGEFGAKSMNEEMEKEDSSQV